MMAAASSSPPSLSRPFSSFFTIAEPKDDPNDLEKAFSSLTINAGGTAASSTSNNSVLSFSSYNPSLLMFHGWLIRPPDQYVTGNLSSSNMDELFHHSVFSPSLSELPLFIPPSSPLSISASITQSAPENKPNLLSALTAFLLHQAKLLASSPPASSSSLATDPNKSSSSSLKDQLKSRLSSMIFASRNPLKKILESIKTGKEWKIYATDINGALFIERGDYYDNVEGTVGLLFEQSVVKKGKLNIHRNYSIVQAKVGTMNIVLTGEADAIDKAGKVIEIKTKPSWRGDDRHYMTWLQCKLTGVKTIVQAGFTTARGAPKGSPVFFNPKNIALLNIDDYAQGSVLKSDEEKAFAVYYNVLDQLQSYCKKYSGQVFRMDYQPMKNEITIRPIDPSSDPIFPINATVIDRVIEGVIKNINTINSTDKKNITPKK